MYQPLNINLATIWNASESFISDLKIKIIPMKNCALNSNNFLVNSSRKTHFLKEIIIKIKNLFALYQISLKYFLSAFLI